MRDPKILLTAEEMPRQWYNLAAERGIGFWPGEDYGCPGFIRLALPQGDGWRDDITDLERRLSAGL